MSAKLHGYHALLLSCDAHCWRAELVIGHANLRRTAAALATAKLASALLYDNFCVISGIGVWASWCVLRGVVSDAMVSNITGINVFD